LQKSQFYSLFFSFIFFLTNLLIRVYRIRFENSALEEQEEIIKACGENE